MSETKNPWTCTNPDCHGLLNGPDKEECGNPLNPCTVRREQGEPPGEDTPEYEPNDQASAASSHLASTTHHPVGGYSLGQHNGNITFNINNQYNSGPEQHGNGVAYNSYPSGAWPLAGFALG